MLTDVFLPVGLAVIMGSLGLSLTIGDFKRIVTSPRGVAIGLANLLLISPFLALGVAKLFDLDPLLAVGLVLLGAAPGGTLANLLTHLARGETALSVSMTAISSVLAVVTVPLYLGIAIDYFDAPVDDDVSMAGIVVKVFAITIVPLSIGMAYRARRELRARELEPKLKRVAIGAFIVIVALAVFEERERLAESFWAVAPAALVLNVAAMSLSFSIARLSKLSNPQSTAIAMELGLHNSTVAIAVATLVNDELAIPGAVYSAFMFITAGLFARVMHQRNALQPA